MMMMVTWQDSVDMTHKLTAFILAQHKKHKEASKSSGKDGTYYDDDSEWAVYLFVSVIVCMLWPCCYLSLLYLSNYASIYSSIYASIYSSI